MTEVDSGTKTERSSTTVRVSIVVPVRNEARHIRRTLEQLLALEAESIPYEILVIDGESTDGTPDLVREIQAIHPRIRLYSNPRRLSSGARNIGVKHAAGELIVIVDGHCDVTNPRYLRDLVDAFERSGADCLGRPQPLDLRDATRLQRAIAAARSSWLGHHPASHIYSDAEQFVAPQSVAVAYRRSVFDRVGGFDETFDACEDVEFNLRVERAGLTCFFTPKISVTYHPRGSLSGLLRQMRRYGRGRARLRRKYRQTFLSPCSVPALFVAGLVVGPLASFASPHLASAFLAALLLYGLALISAVGSIAIERRSLELVPWLLIIFPTIHVGTGLGFIEELSNGGFVARNSRVAVDRVS
jgi:succinoglycan biosynthesis protein ExoA